MEVRVNPDILFSRLLGFTDSVIASCFQLSFILCVMLVVGLLEQSFYFVRRYFTFSMLRVGPELLS